ncbi:MAG: Uma2 family endonuclease [Thermoanaerobaculia bacterium]
MSRKALIDTDAGSELTIAEWYAMAEDEAGELVDGRLVEEELPGYLHEALVILLGSILRGWAVPLGGLVAGSEAKFAVTPRRGRKPDLTVYLPGSRRPPSHGPIDVPPDVAVEIVSPTPRDGRRDRVEKVGDYAAFGIRFYWILDPQLRSLEVLELTAEGRYIHALGASEGKIDNVPGCEGLILDLGELWAEIDRIESTSSE